MVLETAVKNKCGARRGLELHRRMSIHMRGRIVLYAIIGPTRLLAGLFTSSTVTGGVITGGAATFTSAHSTTHILRIHVGSFRTASS